MFFKYLCSITARCVVILVALIFGFVLKESWPILKNMVGIHLFTDEGWFPTSDAFNIVPMIWATLAASMGAIILATPLGILWGVCVQFYAPVWIKKYLQRIMIILSGIPSVVFGFWGLTVLVPLITSWHPPGTSLLAAIFILMLMILPTIALTSEVAFSALPSGYLQGASALGLTRKSFVLKVAIPAARKGIHMGVVLAAARALGETMAVLMVAGNVVQTPTSIFQSVRVLTANIALEMSYAVGNHRSALFASGLILILLVMGLAWFAHTNRERQHVLF